MSLVALGLDVEEIEEGEGEDVEESRVRDVDVEVREKGGEDVEVLNAEDVGITGRLVDVIEVALLP